MVWHLTTFCRKPAPVENAIIEIHVRSLTGRYRADEYVLATATVYATYFDIQMIATLADVVTLKQQTRVSRLSPYCNTLTAYRI